MPEIQYGQQHGKTWLAGQRQSEGKASGRLAVLKVPHDDPGFAPALDECRDCHKTALRRHADCTYGPGGLCRIRHPTGWRKHGSCSQGHLAEDAQQLTLYHCRPTRSCRVLWLLEVTPVGLIQLEAGTSVMSA